MRAAALALTALLLACGPPSAEGRARAIESGLVEDLGAPGWKTVSLAERMAFHRAPGVSIAVVADFAISWAKGYGTRRAGANEPVTPDTLFQTASIGKPVVAATALALVQAGKLDLDGDVNDRLRTWRVPGNEFTAQAPVTLQRLLRHTAGTTHHGYLGYPRGAPRPTVPQILDGLPPANSPPIRVESVPGAGFRYSNGGYVIVQQLLTDVTGREFPDLVGETVFTPLGMDDSIFHPLPEEQWGRAASGHRTDGRIVRGGWHVYAELGAGVFWSTPSDMARFCIALMRGYHGSTDGPLAQAMARELLSGTGVAVGDDGGDRFWAMHDGANEGFRTLLVLYPKRGQGAVIMTNGDGGEALARELTNAVSREYGWTSGLVMELWQVVALAVAAAGLVVVLVRRKVGRAS